VYAENERAASELCDATRRSAVPETQN